MMNKRTFIWTVAIMLLSLHSFSQSSRKLVLSVIPSDKLTVEHRSIYLMSDEIIFLKVPIYENRAVFCLEDEIIDSITYVAMRNKCKGIERVRLDYLKGGKSITMTDAVISLTNDFVYADSEITKQGKDEFVSSEDMKQWLDFTPKNQKLLTDTVRWFFPTVLLNDVESHRKYLADSIYLSNFKRDFGRFPTAKEFDSLCRRTAFNTAETLIGWYSWHLLRLQEKELCNECVNNTYRFTMISNFHYYNYEPCSFRIELRDDGQAVLYCSYEKRNAYEKELYCDIYPMDEQDLSGFQKLLNKIDFWNACPNDEPASLAEKSINYILEANVDGQYHVIFRGEGEDPALDELQKFLWSLTGLGENKIVHKRQRIE